MNCMNIIGVHCICCVVVCIVMCVCLCVCVCAGVCVVFVCCIRVFKIYLCIIVSSLNFYLMGEVLSLIMILFRIEQRAVYTLLSCCLRLSALPCQGCAYIGRQWSAPTTTQIK